MKRVLAAAIAWSVLLALSPAPIKDTNTDHLSPEKSQAARTEEQRAYQLGEVGSTPQVEGAEQAPSIEQGTGSDAVSQASEAKKGADAVKTATKEMDAEQHKGGFNWFLGIFVVGLVFGAFQAFKFWANKNLPEPGKF